MLYQSYSLLRRSSVLVLQLCLALVLALPAISHAATNQIALLVPDGFSLPDPRVSAWLDGAQEEGLKMTVITDTQFQQGTTPAQFSGVILPDQVHVKASDALIAALETYTNQGGKLMLVYDFGALTPTGFYAPQKSRLSNLAGVDYVLYDQLLGNMIGVGPITALGTTLRTLQVPPGKSMLWDASTTPPIEGISGYVYGFLIYPSFVTQGTYTGSALITSPNFGLVAGLRNWLGQRAVRQPAARLPEGTDRRHADARLPALLRRQPDEDGAAFGAAQGAWRAGAELALLRRRPDRARGGDEYLGHLRQ